MSAATGTPAPATGHAPAGRLAPGMRCAPLRDGPLWERLLRYALALALVGAAAYGIAQSLRSATLVEGGRVHSTLVNDIAAGQVTTIDDTDPRHVRWRLRDGTVFAERRYPDLVDLRATVEAQPYVRAHPGAIRYARIDAPIPERDRGGWGSLLTPLLALAAMLLVVTGPEPRHLTHWGWFFTLFTGVGLVAYLLLAGSRRRTVPDVSPRLDGPRTLCLVVVAVVAFRTTVDFPPRPVTNEHTRADTSPVVRVRA